MSDPKLYIIATPLGNRDDITLRALGLLKELGDFFVEDSREFSKLLDLYGISSHGKNIRSYASHNMKEATERALEELRAGKSVGFASDRGTPCVSDPGALLVRHARREGFSVVPVPGASSVTSLMSVSGFSADRFVFVGFVPTASGEREELWKFAETCPFPLCFFESPKRVRKTAEDLKSRFPDRELFFGREMTKLFESFGGGLLRDLEPGELMEKGEYALALGAPEEKQVVAADWGSEIDVRLGSDKAWSKHIAERYGISATEVYNALQLRKREGTES